MEIHFSERVLRSAREATDKGYVEKDRYGDIWRVRSLNRDKSYKVQVITDDEGRVIYAPCTCPNGRALGGQPNCYHAASVLAAISHIELPESKEKS